MKTRRLRRWAIVALVVGGALPDSALAMRQYAAKQQRFMQRDPLRTQVLLPVRPDEIANAYLYVGRNPAVAADPTGLTVVPPYMIDPCESGCDKYEGTFIEVTTKTWSWTETYQEECWLWSGDVLLGKGVRTCPRSCNQGSSTVRSKTITWYEPRGLASCPSSTSVVNWSQTTVGEPICIDAMPSQCSECVAGTPGPTVIHPGHTITDPPVLLKR